MDGTDDGKHQAEKKTSHKKVKNSFWDDLAKEMLTLFYLENCMFAFLNGVLIWVGQVAVDEGSITIWSIEVGGGY